MGRWQFWPIQNIAHLLFPSNLIVIFRDSNPSKFMFIRNMYDIPLIWYWFQHDSLSSSFIYLSPLAPRTPWQWLLSLADGWLAQLVTVQLAILHFGFIIPTIWEWFLHVFTQQKWPFLPSSPRWPHGNHSVNGKTSGSIHPIKSPMKPPKKPWDPTWDPTLSGSFRYVHS